MQDLDSLLVFVEPLDALDLDYFVTGSVAAIIYGEPRMTHDVDLVLHLRAGDTDRLVEAFDEEHFYCPPADALRLETRRSEHGHFNLIHHATGFKADVYLKGQNPLHAWAFARRREVPLPGGSLWVAPPEYVILRKLEFYREGGSDKHLQDIQGILAVSGSSLDRSAIDRWVNKMKLQEQWRLALC